LQRKSHHKDESLEESSDEATWFFVMNNILFIKPTLTPPPPIDVRVDLKGYWLYRKVREREWKKAEPEFLEWEFNNPANEGRLFPRGIALDPHSFRLLKVCQKFEVQILLIIYVVSVSKNTIILHENNELCVSQSTFILFLIKYFRTIEFSQLILVIYTHDRGKSWHFIFITHYLYHCNKWHKFTCFPE
jgi:hypothetical protein